MWTWKPIFLNLFKKHFSANNSFQKIFNKNTIKITYSCMKNISSIIASHNKWILRPKARKYSCKCRNKDSYPLQNKCLSLKVIYKATVINNGEDEKRVCFGSSDKTFKEWYRHHTQDFIHERYSKSTALSKYIWQLKRNNKISIFEWKFVRKVFYDAKSICCLFCLREKYFIINYPHEEILLNK